MIDEVTSTTFLLDGFHSLLDEASTTGSHVPDEQPSRKQRLTEMDASPGFFLPREEIHLQLDMRELSGAFCEAAKLDRFHHLYRAGKYEVVISQICAELRNIATETILVPEKGKDPHDYKTVLLDLLPRVIAKSMLVTRRNTAP